MILRCIGGDGVGTVAFSELWTDSSGRSSGAGRIYFGAD